MEQIIFSFTLFVTIVNLFKVISCMAGNQFNFWYTDTPISLTGFFMAVPSMLYQAWYWAPAIMLTPAT